MAQVPPVVPGPPVAPYVPLIGDAIVTDGITENNAMAQILHWIGFRTEISRNSIYEDALSSYTDAKVLTENDISDMVKDFGNRTAQNGRFHIGSKRAKKLKGFVHWVQDFYRVSEDPTIVGLNEHTFISALEASQKRANVRRSLKDNSDTASKAADPGPLKSEKQWREWEEKFENFLGCIIGVNGIPLKYVIRENENPDTTTEHPNFVAKTIACAPLIGEYFLADRQAVFNYIVSFTTGQPSGDWIKSTLRYCDGRRSMEALRNHFAGEGNASRNKAVADSLKKSLFYKNEKTMSFEVFLTKCQYMYNIYDKEGEPMVEDSKLRFLYTHVQHPGLIATVEELKVQKTAGIEITYTKAANHLSTAVSELPEYSANRNVSALGGSDSKKKGSPAIYKEDGSINTGHIDSWHNLSRFDKNIVISERKRLKMKPGKWKENDSNKNSANANRLKQLEDQCKVYKRRLQAIKRSNSDRNGDGIENDANENIDAADQFGGKASKKRSKNG